MAYSAETYLADVPGSFGEINSREDKEEWLHAVNEEISALKKNNTWSLCSLPEGKKAINSMWIFKVKCDDSSNIERRKARLVIKGRSQRPGFDYSETYAPVARLTTLRFLLAVVNERNLLIYQMDVKNAFLHSDLEEEVFMKVPDGVDEDGTQVCKLNKTLYGLKQAPRPWNSTFDTFMKTLGMKNSEADRCLYIGEFRNAKIYLLLYVDDIIIAGNNEKRIQKIKIALKNKFFMKDLGKLSTFLGIKITNTSNGLFLSQESYLKKLLTKFNMSDCKSVRTPMECNFVNDYQDKLSEDKPYRELVGCLMYLTQTTRSDISFSVNFFSRFQSEPKENHWKGLKRILRYIQGTLNYGLIYYKSNKRSREPLTGFADADWGSAEDRKSTSGFCLPIVRKHNLLGHAKAKYGCSVFN